VVGFAIAEAPVKYGELVAFEEWGRLRDEVSELRKVVSGLEFI